MQASPRLSLFKSKGELTALAVFAVMAVVCAWFSDGFVTADACTHYLFAKYAFSDPVNFVDVWARPLCTLIDSVPAYFGGVFAVRVVHIGIAVGCAVVARAIAAGQPVSRPGWALLFTLGAPLFFLFSFSEMTELPFALVLGLAVLCYQKERWIWLALLAGLLPAARPEGFGFVLLAGLALVVRRKWVGLIPLIAPLLLWDVAGWLITGRPGHWYAWLVHAWPWSEQGLYGRGSIFTFVATLPVIVPPLILPATLVGIGRRLGTRTRDVDWHARVCQLTVVGIPLGVLVGHSLLRWLGKFGSFGEARYLLICAPLWGVVSAVGFEWLSDRLRFRRPWRVAVVGVVLPTVVNFVSPVVPIHLPPDWKTARRFAELYRGEGMEGRYPHVIAAHPAIVYFLNVDPNHNGREDAFTASRIKQVPEGALLMWDPVYCTTNAIAEDAATPDQIRAAGWVEDVGFSEALNEKLGARRWIVFKSRGRDNRR